MARLLVQLMGAFFLIIGIILLILPIPFGVFFTLLGLLLLIPSSPWISAKIRDIRGRYAKVDSMFAKVTSRLPLPYRRILRSTEPDYWS